MDEEEEEDVDLELEGEKCSFCGRSPFDVERMLVQGEVRICNICIKEFHGRLNLPPKPKS